jgi:hypothetical protein
VFPDKATPVALVRHTMMGILLVAVVAVRERVDCRRWQLVEEVLGKVVQE